MSDHILIVDDSAELCEVMQAALTDQGYDVTCATSGQDARQALHQHSIDLALVDLLMPGTPGLIVAQEIAATGAAVVLMTAALAEELPDHLEFAVLRKPFRLEVLRDIVHRALAERRHDSGQPMAL
jgi:DNA-binding NtrC family response regulator